MVKRGGHTSAAGGRSGGTRQASKAEVTDPEMSDDEMDTSHQNQAVITKLTNEVGQLRNTVTELRAHVEFLMSALGWTLPVSSGGSSEDRQSIAATGDESASALAEHKIDGHPVISYADAVQRPTVLQRNMRDAVIAAVYIDQKRKDSRAAHIVVSGLQPQPQIPDQNIVSDLCRNELGLVPDIVSCKRLGKEAPDRVQPLLVVLRTADQADQLLAHAKKLRKSSHAVIRDNVFINRHMTAAQSRAAYELRCQRRLSGKQDKKELTGLQANSSSVGAKLSLNTKAPEFVMPSLSSGAVQLPTVATTAIAASSD